MSTRIQIRATCLTPVPFYSKPWTQDCRAEPTPWPILSLETLLTWSMLVSLLAALPIGKRSRVFDSPRQLVPWLSVWSSWTLLVWLFLAPRLSPVLASSPSWRPCHDSHLSLIRLLHVIAQIATQQYQMCKVTFLCRLHPFPLLGMIQRFRSGVWQLPL